MVTQGGHDGNYIHYNCLHFQAVRFEKRDAISRSGMPFRLPFPMPSPWSLPKRIAFRFACAYLFIYNFPFPFNAIPQFESWSAGYDALWERIVRPVGKAVFGADAAILPNGSGDTTFNYVQLFCFFVLAVAATLIWSLLDRKREEYSRLDAWLRMYVRFSLAAAMVLYGTAKVIPSQFPPPSLSKLMLPFGEQSPMGLLWSFMGASKAYMAFTGLAEMTAGILLTMRRTMLLGALIAVGVMSNVVMLNFCYDVPVKLYSSHLLLMALFLAAPHAKRLADFFLFNRVAQPKELPRLLPEHWSRVAVPALRTAVVVIYTGAMLFYVWENYESNFVYYPKPAFHGVWNVEEFVVDGQPRPPLLSDAARWRSVIFDYSTLTVRGMDDARTRFRAKIDMAKKQIDISSMTPKKKAVLTFLQPRSSTLVLQGLVDGKSVRATLQRVDKPFLLTSRGFHWINEYSMNR